ncbi:MAG TPA: Ig-like domain-containing protein [Tepidisphaeraceae bacterium]|jgi:hypothetical protein
MRHAFVFEAVESRTLMSAVGPTRSGVQVIGPTGGVHASASTPKFDKLVVTSDGSGTENNADAVDRASAIRLTIIAADNHGGIDPNNGALVRAAVQITNIKTGVVYNGTGLSGTQDITKFLQKIKTTGGGDALIIQPNAPWDPNTRYRVEVNGSFVSNGNKVRDVEQTRFAAVSKEFTTSNYLPSADNTIGFKQIPQSAPGNRAYIATTIGPDHRLYAATSQGYIYRYDIAKDGTLSNEFTIDIIRQKNGGNRIITGITFEPGATVEKPTMWVSHNQYRFGSKPGQGSFYENAENFTGKISRIGKADFSSYEDIVINIPRSARDHMNNQIVFAKSGRTTTFLFGIAAMNAMGRADNLWAGREENIYSASIVRVRIGNGDTALNPYLKSKGPVDLRVRSDGTTPYNVFKGSNPLRLFATGVRNDFDMVLHSNGHLYAGINGSSAGGNVPATPAFSQVPIQNRVDKDKKGRDTFTGPDSPALTGVRQVMQDTLLDLQEGAYYGHPNPARGEYVLMGGNPTSKVDPFEVAAYDVGQQPDRNFTLPAYDFGQNVSPNGMIEYKSVGGRNKNLDGYLIVTRYSGGADLLAIKPNRDGSVTPDKINRTVQERITGFTNLGSPLDVVEDMTNGNLYVVSLETETGPGSIILLRPDSSLAPKVSASASKLGFYVTPGGPAVTRKVTLTNTGTQDLIFDPAASRIGGTGRRNFLYGKNFPKSAYTLTPGASLTLNITGQLLKGQTDTAAATLQLKVNDPDRPTVNVLLRAFDETAA